jgi:hydroxymethylpyrimidine pyrophosphatase-like HAD family hydrolase
MAPRVVFVDVDDTLIRSVGTKRIPMPRVVAYVRSLHSTGCVLYLWSTGGADYARQSAQELGLLECFNGYLPKPNLMIDDQPVPEWTACEHLYPMQVP